MFELTLLDHLRLTFGHVVHRHNAHARIAQSRATWDRALRATEALLMIGTTLAAVAVASGRGRGYAVTAAVLAGLAVVALLIQLAFDLDRSANAHRACATRLWHVRERYRALLSDLTDGAIDVEAARARRDVLMSELHGIYENAPAGDHRAYAAARRAVPTVDDRALSDEEIDVFLPRSLRKTAQGEGTPQSPVTAA